MAGQRMKLAPLTALLVVAAAVLTQLLLLTPVAAWDCPGHMLTAEIARLNLPSDVNDYFDAIARFNMAHYPRQTIPSELACWPDDIKTYMPSQYNPWHYMDACFNPRFEVPCPTDGEGDLKVALTAALARIAAPNATAAERSFWLAFMFHMVGDFHQPLHIVGLYDARFPSGDLGGNRYIVQFNGSFVNLHSWHDAVGGQYPPEYFSRPMAAFPDGVMEFKEIAHRLNARFAHNATVDGNTNLDQWTAEGFDIAAHYSYENGRLIFNGPLMPAYITNLRGILDYRLTTGGRRLATLLQRVYEEMKASGITDPTR